MSKLVWDASGERLFETGVDRGVLFPMTNGAYGTGVAWNGLTAVNDTPSGGEPTKLYADNIAYITLMSVEELGLTIEAYTYPDEFEECDGYKELSAGVVVGQQTRKHFGFSYRTLIGNDEESTDHGYKIHLVYDCVASPSDKSHSTVNDSPEAEQLSWDVATTPVAIPLEGAKPSAEIIIDSTEVDETKLKAIEALLYGTEQDESTMPSPAKLLEILTKP
jgi:hypothetical protein